MLSFPHLRFRYSLTLAYKWKVLDPHTKTITSISHPEVIPLSALLNISLWTQHKTLSNSERPLKWSNSLATYSSPHNPVWFDPSSCRQSYSGLRDVERPSTICQVTKISGDIQCVCLSLPPWKSRPDTVGYQLIYVGMLKSVCLFSWDCTNLLKYIVKRDTFSAARHFWVPL